MYATFEWDEDMHEVTGVGGLEERAARAAICAGAQWLIHHPNADPEIEGSMEGSDGYVIGTNDDGRAFMHAINTASFVADDGTWGPLSEQMTPALYYASLYHMFYIAEYGWARYRQRMSDPMPLFDEETAVHVEFHTVS